MPRGIIVLVLYVMQVEHAQRRCCPLNNAGPECQGRGFLPALLSL